MSKTLYINPDLQAWLDPLLPTELAGLEASLLADGCRDPLVVWSDGCLLDGHNRYALCTKHGIPFQTVEKTGLVTKEDAMLWMIDNQFNKRNMTDFARVALALKRKPLLEARAKARMLAGQADPRLNSDEGPVRTDESIAKAAGVGRDTVRKVEKIIEKADAEVIAKVRNGELSINAAAKTVAQTKPPKVEAGSIQREPEFPTPPLSPKQGKAPVSQIDELLPENAALKADLAETLAENVQLRAELHERDAQLNALTSEKSALIEQLGDLAEMFQEAMTCHDEMRTFLEAVPLPGMSHQLGQALELARTFDGRVAAAPRRRTEAQSEQYCAVQPVGDTTIRGDHFVELTKAEPLEHQPSVFGNSGPEPALDDSERGTESDAVEVSADAFHINESLAE